MPARRSDALVTLTRREVCVGLAACLGAAIVGGCGDSGNNSPTDAPLDSTGSGSCSTSGTDVGTPATFVANTPKYFSTGNFFVVRDANGLYALTARCTHQGSLKGI